eukprot:Lithocolla_globosa_v1_NODE_627_length_3566_cov_26.673028.p2 type:complete len:327 gc:universal NODE_627_length_3566_cov_26.673028:1758-778(-)
MRGSPTPTPISTRWSIIYLYIILLVPFKEIERLLLVPTSTSSDIVSLYQRTGDVEAEVRSGRPQDATPEEMELIYAIVQDNPTIYLDELQDEIFSTTGANFSLPTLYRCLKRLGMSRKKVTYYARNQDLLHQVFYMNIMSRVVTSLDQLIFVDETGTDLRNARRLYGYSLRGIDISQRTPFTHKGRRHSAIAALNTSGVVGLKMVTGTSNSRTFLQFIDEQLLPILQPYPFPNSIVVLDNASIHHFHECKQMIESYGAFVVFLPPYSPKLNPIEEIFGMVKMWLRRNREFVLEEYARRGHIRYALLRAFLAISPEIAYNTIRHAGY